MKTLRSLLFPLILLLSVLSPSCGHVAFAQGTTVVGGLGPGLGQSVNPFDSAYQEQQKIANLIQRAELANANAAAAYARVSQDWLTNAVSARDAGRPIPTIVDPPLRVHVDPKTGAQTTGPDAVATRPVLPAPSGNLGSHGAIANTNAPPDRIDQLLAQQKYLYELISKIAAKLGLQ